jgi:CxxC motif-containing protein
MRELICICCPIGCRLKVEGEEGNLVVTGNQCKRGIKYAIEEVTAPKRLITSIVPVRDGKINMVSVKTSDMVPKQLIFEVLDTLKNIEIEAPIKIGEVILKNILNTGIDFIATKNVEKKSGGNV